MWKSVPDGGTSQLAVKSQILESNQSKLGANFLEQNIRNNLPPAATVWWIKLVLIKFPALEQGGKFTQLNLGQFFVVVVSIQFKEQDGITRNTRWGYTS